MSVCEICDEKIPQLTNVKAHFEAKHNASKHTGYPNGVRHVTPSRENSEVYDNNLPIPFFQKKMNFKKYS